MNRGLHFNDSSLRSFPPRLGMFLHDVDLLHDRTFLLRIDFEDSADLPLLFPSKDRYLVILLYEWVFLLLHRSSPLALSEDLRGKRDDFHKILRSQLSGDRTEYPGSYRLILRCDQHR